MALSSAISKASLAPLLSWREGGSLGRCSVPSPQPGSVFLFVFALSATTCDLCLTTATNGNKCVVVVSSAIRLNVPLAWLPSTVKHTAQTAFYIPASSVATCASATFTVCDGVGAFGPLVGAAIKKMLHGCVVAMSATCRVPCGVVQGFTSVVSLRVTRVLPSIGFVRVGPDTRIYFAAFSDPGLLNTSLIPSPVTSVSSPRIISPWKTTIAPTVSAALCARLASTSLSHLGAAEQQLWQVFRTSITQDSFELPPFVMQKGVLLFGAQGIGKMSVARRLAHAVSHAGVSVLLVHVSIQKLLALTIGALDTQLSRAFHVVRSFNGGGGLSTNSLAGIEINVLAAATQSSKCCSVLILSDIHLLLPAHPSIAASRLLKQLLISLCCPRQCKTPVLIVGTSLYAASPALMRPGRFDVEIEIFAPNADSRLAILTNQLLPVSQVVFFELLPKIVESSAGCIAMSLVAAAKSVSLALLCASWHGAALSETQLHTVLCAARGRGSATLFGSGNQHFANFCAVGGLGAVICQLQQAIEGPLHFQAEHAIMDVRPPRGILLYGPPGNSKTTLVRALANSTAAAFFSVSASEVFSAYVGEAERVIRDLFRSARSSQPSIIFLDEIDSLVGSRGISSDLSNNGNK
jgi:ATP-dependent 26S proteasome regulatory subunit